MVAAALVAACSSGHGGTQGGTSSPAASAQAANNAGNKPAIKVIVQNNEGSTTSLSQPEVSAAALATFKYINDKLGGINGQKFDVSVCKTEPTPASSAQCANTIVDKKPDVVVRGTEVAFDAGALPILSQAQIPIIAFGSADADLKDPDVFDVGAGAVSWFTGAVAIAAEKKYSKIGFLTADVPTTHGSVASLLDPAAAKAGVTVKTLYVPVTAPDVTQYVANVISGQPAAVFLATAESSCTQLVSGLLQAGYKGKIYINDACEGPTFYKTLGNQVTGMYIYSASEARGSGDPSYKSDTQTLQDIASAEGVPVPVGTAATVVRDIFAMYRALKAAPSGTIFNRETIATAMKAAKNIPVFQGGGATGSCGAVASLPSLCATTTFLINITGADSWTFGGAVDLTKYLS
jgi:branched-chain amino acid transport system substrate-binding protein